MSENARAASARIVILPVGSDEAESISRLAAEIWRRHYPGIISEAQIEYMLEQRYAPDRIRLELAHNEAWWDKLAVDGAAVGLTAYFLAQEAGEMKLDKLYVHPDHQRKGYGGRLIAHVCERARTMGLSRVTLTVNRRNAQAIAAYLKHGFTVRSTRVLDIGAGFVMDDYVMCREL